MKNRISTIAVAALVAATTLFAAARGATAAAPAPKHFIALLGGAQETPPSPSTGFGMAHLTFDEPSKMLCVTLTYGDLSAPETAAHIHGPALPGVPAGILFALPPGNPKNACVGPFDKAAKANLFKNLLYVNVHSLAFPAGEIRGQILRIK